MAKLIALMLLTAAVSLAQFSFHPPTSSPTLDGPVAMVTADFNGDGVADLAISDTGSQVIAIWLGEGGGTFQQSATYQVASTCQVASLFMGDFTGDHKLDLLGICFFESQVLVFPGHGDGTFGAAVPSSLPAAAFAGDIPLLGVAAGISGTVGDLNGDGKLDLALVLVNNLESFPPSPTSIYFLPGNGDGTFGTAAPVPGVNQAVTLTSGDFNGDGKLDLAYLTALPGGTGTVEKFGITDQTYGILLGNGDGTFTAETPQVWPGAIFALSAADLNGDGFLDLYSAGSRQPPQGGFPVSVVTVMLGDGKGNFTQAFSAQDPNDELATSYCLASFSETGEADLLETFSDLSGVKLEVAGTSYGVRQGDGKGGFGSVVPFAGPMTTYSGASVCADFNGDGLTDVAFAGMIVDGIETAFKGLTGAFQSIDTGLALLPPGDLYVALNANAPPARTFGITNGASYAAGPLAADSIASAFWNGPNNVNGIAMNVQDSAGVTRAAQIFFVSSTQINYWIPAGTALGQATVNITGAPNPFSAPLKIVTVAPGIFNLGGVAIGYADTVASNGNQTYTTISSPNASGVYQPTPIDVSGGNVFLLLYGTGIRNHANPVTATIGSMTLPAAYAGAQGSFVGEDQINIALPASLAGAGLLKVTLTADGQTSNAGQIQIK